MMRRQVTALRRREDIPRRAGADRIGKVIGERHETHMAPFADHAQRPAGKVRL